MFEKRKEMIYKNGFIISAPGEGENNYLYRAKTTIKETQREFNNTWVIGNLISSGGKHYIHPQHNRVSVIGELGKCIVMHEVIPDTICRSMRVSEKTIWENDIFRWIDAAYGQCTGIVGYGEYAQDGSGGEYPATPCYGFYIEVVKVESFEGSFIDESDYPDYLRKISVLSILSKKENVENVGNALDNPELLKC